MPYTTNPVDNVRIHYEVHGNGPAIVFHHGGGSSLERWYEYGYVDALRHDFQVMLMDARGHGKSDRPRHADAYRYERLVSDIVLVLDDAGVERAHFFGYSLGGLIGFRIPEYAPDRFLTLILGGAHPYATYDFFNRQYLLFRNGLETYLEIREEENQPVEGAELEHLKAADLGVYAAVGEALRDEPDALDHVKACTLPLLLFMGSDDATDNSNEKLPMAARCLADSTLLMFSGRGHREVISMTGVLVAYVRAFLSTAYK